MKERYEAVLLDIAFGRDSVRLRYNDASETYTQNFAVMRAPDASTALQEKPGRETVLKFLEFAEAGEAENVTPRRLVLTDPELNETVLYDDKNMLSRFKYNFNLRGNTLLFLHQTSPRCAEKLTA